MSEITVCPECDSSQVAPFSKRNCGPNTNPDNHDYRCDECDWTGDKPNTRAKKMNDDSNARGVNGIQTLLDADKDEYP